MSILRYSDVNSKKINYGKPEKQGMIYYAPIDYNNEPLYLQLPRMICKSNGPEIVKRKSTMLDIETLNNDYSFYDFMLNLDERNIKETFKNNELWFNKNIPLEIIDDMYKRTCKPIKKESKPIFSFKIPVVKEKVQCQIYDQKKTFIDISKVISGAEMICILHIRGLKFLKQHYYCDCYISQIKVILPKDEKFSILENYAFDDKEEEEAEIAELERDLRLYEEYLLSLQNDDDKKSEEDKLKIQSELDIAKERYNELKLKIESLESKLNSI